MRQETPNQAATAIDLSALKGRQCSAHKKSIVRRRERGLPPSDSSHTRWVVTIIEVFPGSQMVRVEGRSRMSGKPWLVDAADLLDARTREPLVRGLSALRACPGCAGTGKKCVNILKAVACPLCNGTGRIPKTPKKATP